MNLNIINFLSKPFKNRFYFMSENCSNLNIFSSLCYIWGPVTMNWPFSSTLERKMSSKGQPCLKSSASKLIKWKPLLYLCVFTGNHWYHISYFTVFYLHVYKYTTCTQYFKRSPGTGVTEGKWASKRMLGVKPRSSGWAVSKTHRVTS